jgi:DNA-binding NarL/FixJ family response regulator
MMSEASFRDRPLTVAVMGEDVSSIEDFRSYLRKTSLMRLISSQHSGEAQVMLVLTRRVRPELIAELRAVTSAASGYWPRVVVVTESVPESQLPELIGCGVVSILPRGAATPKIIARTLLASHNGGAVLPNAVTRWLIDHARIAQAKILVTADRQAAIFTAREIEVLRLLAAGHDTVEIAEQLNYSVRMIKKIISSMLTRLDLRNRVHAVSFAIRVGAI